MLCEFTVILSLRKMSNRIAGKCGHCLTPCTMTCSNCNKVSYCSREHQKADRKRHKQTCFPAVLTFSEALGNHLVATREIRKGEIILEDEPLLLGPRSNLAHFAKICLGCCAEVQTDHKCSACSWSLCSLDCQEVRSHDKELQIYTELSL